MTIHDLGGEIFKNIQSTPLVSMRPMTYEWRSLFKSCDSLSFVRCGKKELQHRLSGTIQWLSSYEQESAIESHGLLAEDLAMCMKEADLSFLYVLSPKVIQKEPENGYEYIDLVDETSEIKLDETTGRATTANLNDHRIKEQLDTGSKEDKNQTNRPSILLKTSNSCTELNMTLSKRNGADDLDLQIGLWTDHTKEMDFQDGSDEIFTQMKFVLQEIRKNFQKSIEGSLKLNEESVNNVQSAMINATARLQNSLQQDYDISDQSSSDNRLSLMFSILEFLSFLWTLIENQKKLITSEFTADVLSYIRAFFSKLFSLDEINRCKIIKSHEAMFTECLKNILNIINFCLGDESLLALIIRIGIMSLQATFSASIQSISSEILIRIANEKPSLVKGILLELFYCIDGDRLMLIKPSAIHRVLNNGEKVAFMHLLVSRLVFNIEQRFPSSKSLKKITVPQLRAEVKICLEECVSLAVTFLAPVVDKLRKDPNDAEMRTYLQRLHSDLLNIRHTLLAPGAVFLCTVLNKYFVQFASDSKIEINCRSLFIEEIGRSANALNSGKLEEFQKLSPEQILTHHSTTLQNLHIRGCSMRELWAMINGWLSFREQEESQGTKLSHDLVWWYRAYVTILETLVSVPSELEPQSIAVSLRMMPNPISFEHLICQLMHLMNDESSFVRSKVLKTLAQIVQHDTNLFENMAIKTEIHARLFDPSIAVREAALDFLGKYVTTAQESISIYYDMIIESTSDKGLNVRKKALKILKDIASTKLSQNAQIKLRLAFLSRCLDPESSISNLATDFLFDEIFPNAYEAIPAYSASHFETLPIRAQMQVQDSIGPLMSIIETETLDLLALWLEKLRTDPKKAEVVERFLELTSQYVSNRLTDPTINLSEEFVKYFDTMYVISKHQPKLLVSQLSIFEPHLNEQDHLKKDTILLRICLTLQNVLCIMREGDVSIFARLQETLVSLVMKQSQLIVAAATKTLCVLNASLFRDATPIYRIFNYFYGVIQQYDQAAISMEIQDFNTKTLLRAIYIIGLLCQHFDFEVDHLKYEDTLTTIQRHQESLTEIVFQKLVDFATKASSVIRTYSITALGSLYSSHPELILRAQSRSLILSLSEASTQLDISAPLAAILKAFISMIASEKERLERAEKEFRKNASLPGNSKDVSVSNADSGLVTASMGLYSPLIMKALVHPDVQVRALGLNVVDLLLEQGVIHPVECVPSLIALTVDHLSDLAEKSLQLLKTLDEKYPSFLQSRLSKGLYTAFTFLRCLGGPNEFLRGLRPNADGGDIAACLSPLFLLFQKTRLKRQYFLNCLINLLADSKMKKSSQETWELREFVFGNILQLSYTCLDDVLFTIYGLGRLCVSLEHAEGSSTGEVVIDNDDPFKQSDRMNDSHQDGLFFCLLSATRSALKLIYAISNKHDDYVPGDLKAIDRAASKSFVVKDIDFGPARKFRPEFETNTAASRDWLKKMMNDPETFCSHFILLITNNTNSDWTSFRSPDKKPVRSKESPVVSPEISKTPELLNEKKQKLYSGSSPRNANPRNQVKLASPETKTPTRVSRPRSKTQTPPATELSPSPLRRSNKKQGQENQFQPRISVNTMKHMTENIYDKEIDTFGSSPSSPVSEPDW